MGLYQASIYQVSTRGLYGLARRLAAAFSRAAAARSAGVFFFSGGGAFLAAAVVPPPPPAPPPAPPAPPPRCFLRGVEAGVVANRPLPPATCTRLEAAADVSAERGGEGEGEGERGGVAWSRVPAFSARLLLPPRCLLLPGDLGRVDQLPRFEGHWLQREVETLGQLAHNESSLGRHQVEYRPLGTGAAAPPRTVHVEPPRAQLRAHHQPRAAVEQPAHEIHALLALLLAVQHCGGCAVLLGQLLRHELGAVGRVDEDQSLRRRLQPRELLQRLHVLALRQHHAAVYDGRGQRRAGVAAPPGGAREA
eukprot:scaffold54714_cov59-Phaeocystis_antarctica.AAC.5